MSFAAAVWAWHAPNREVLAAAWALSGGALLTWGALRQPAGAVFRLKKRPGVKRAPGTTEVFRQAVGQLGSVKVPVCLGAIYTLERIARASKHDHAVVMDVLTTFVRERARWDNQGSGHAASGLAMELQCAATEGRDGIAGMR